jgi:hypothetical protein
MVTRCDHCRGTLGPDINRYWRMRFAPQIASQPYQRRLDRKLSKRYTVSKREFQEVLHRVNSQKKPHEYSCSKVRPTNFLFAVGGCR